MLVEVAAGQVVRCLARRKQAALSCGDRVAVLLTGREEGVIEAVDPRSSVYLRSSHQRSKYIAANATQAAVVVAAEPSFSDELLMRALIAAAHSRMKGLIILNKVDLVREALVARARLEPFRRAGHAIVAISAHEGAKPLLPCLKGEITVLVGQSGMGKSTLINALFPEAHAATRAISLFLAGGRHTTTASKLYRLDDASALIDSPGMKEFGLAHMTRHEIEAAVPELSPFLGQCRFRGCRHESEPGCAVQRALEQGSIDPRRLELLRRIESSEARM